MSIFYYESKVGTLKIESDGEYLIALSYIKLQEQDISNNEVSIDCIIQKTIKELNEYFNGELKEFTVPIKLSGTPFQNKVWKELLNIPYGTTSSYENVTLKVQKSRFPRAVANAIGKNNIIIIVPCHRVINKNGNLGGFGAGIDLKVKLLKLEKENI